MATKVTLPLADRTFERAQGCWSCRHLASKETSLQHWLSVERPAHEARVAEGKRLIAEGVIVDPVVIRRYTSTGVNDSCPCGSGLTYQRCHRNGDQDAERLFRKIEGIEKAAQHIDEFEMSIRSGHPIFGQMALCDARSSAKYGSYVSDKYLCDQWSAAQGASVARAGAAPDKLPEELVDIHGDGN